MPSINHSTDSPVIPTGSATIHLPCYADMAVVFWNGPGNRTAQSGTAHPVQTGTGQLWWKAMADIVCRQPDPILLSV